MTAKAITNRRKAAEDGPDFYPTPAWATHALLDFEEFSGKVLEPACGSGSMSRVLEARLGRENVISRDLHDHGYGETGYDFLDYTGLYDNIVTNPPYSMAEDFARKAIECSFGKVALLLRLNFLEGQGRAAFYERFPPARVWVFPERVSMFPAGDPRTKGGTTAFSWFVWEARKHPAQRTELRWFPLGLRDKYGTAT